VNTILYLLLSSSGRGEEGGKLGKKRLRKGETVRQLSSSSLDEKRGKRRRDVKKGKGGRREYLFDLT